MATKANPGEFDCYAAAGDDEPIFVLRATDPLAPDIIRQWADNYDLSKQIQNGIGHGKGNGLRPLTERQARKVAESRECANAMDVWFTEKPSAPSQ